MSTAPRTEPRTLAPPERRTARVVEVEQLGAYGLITALDADGPADPRPGQFYMLAAAERWGGGEDERPYLPRAFSYARAREGRLSFLLEAVGPGTERLAELREGEGLQLVGPLGVGWRRARDGTRPVLVGGGIGVAPLVCLQDELLGEPPGASASNDLVPGGRPPEAASTDAPAVLLGFRTAAHAEAAGLFGGARRLQGDPSGAPFVVATDDGSRGRRALVTDLLREQLDRDPAATVFACGPPAMLEAVRLLCAELDVPAQLALESGMACGFGACFGCVVPTREGYVRLCVDGPVLDADQLESAVLAHAPGSAGSAGSPSPGAGR